MLYILNLVMPYIKYMSLKLEKRKKMYFFILNVIANSLSKNVLILFPFDCLFLQKLYKIRLYNLHMVDGWRWKKV